MKFYDFLVISVMTTALEIIIFLIIYQVVKLLTFWKWIKHEIVGIPDGSVVKNSPSNAGDTGDLVLIPELGSSPGEGNGDLLHYSCLENPVDRGAW